MSLKIKRISSEVLKTLSEILRLEAKNKVLKDITLTDCEVTNDLSFAYVYFTYMGNLDIKEVEQELRSSEKYLRTMLANKINLRHTPVIMFKYDNSIEYGQNIERIINKLHEEDKIKEITNE